MDVERLLVDYLNDCDLGVKAYYDVPETRPESFINVVLTGGAYGDTVDAKPMLSVKCWGKTRKDTVDLSGKVIKALRHMGYVEPNVFRAEINSVFKDTDIDTGTPRYQVVTTIYLNE